MNPALQAASFFVSEQDINHLEPFGTGNVNDTYLLTTKKKEQFVLQRVNPVVFPDPHHVQHNLRVVTKHLEKQFRHNPAEKFPYIRLTMHTGHDGDTHQDEDGVLWRMVNRIPGVLFDTVNRPAQAEELGRGLGYFHRLLSTLPPENLRDTLPGFHHTPTYLKQYDQVRDLDRLHAASDEKNFCHRFIDQRRSLASLLDSNSALSKNIIHGDPKVANFVFDEKGSRVVSLIDLDTVRYGLLLHDIGDGLRSCCNPSGENPPAPADTVFNVSLFTAWLKGYASEAEMLLTRTDKEHIVEAVRIITFELGLRFFTDHMDGDRYFKIRYPGHNLFRARVQFQLVRTIEDQAEELREIVARTTTD